MEQRISVERMEQAVNIFGSFDENIRLIEAEFHVASAMVFRLLSSWDLFPSARSWTQMRAVPL